MSDDDKAKEAVAITPETRIDDKVEALMSVAAEGVKVNFMARWEMGRILTDVYNEEMAQAGTYGKGAFKKIAQKLSDRIGEKINESTLYNYQTLAMNVSQDEMNQLVAIPGVNYSKLLKLVRRLKDTNKRAEFLEQHKDLSVREFEAKLEEAVPTPEVTDPPPLGQESSSSSNQGGGSRTGTGHGKSPSSPFKKFDKLSDKILDLCSEMVLSLKEFDPDTEKQVELYEAAVQEAATHMKGVVETFQSVCNEADQYLGSNPIETFRLKQAEKAEPDKKPKKEKTKTENKENQDKPDKAKPSAVEQARAKAKAKADAARERAESGS